GELLGRDRLARDVEALGWFDKVWGRVETGAHATGTETGFDHGAGGSFAVGAGDMHEMTGLVWIAKRFKEECDAIQAEFGGVDLVAQGVEVADSLGIVHASIVSRENRRALLRDRGIDAMLTAGGRRLR